jgi:hypothetical protein
VSAGGSLPRAPLFAVVGRGWLPRALLVAVAAGGLLLAGCAPSRIHRLTKEVYPAKAAFARVDVFAGRLTRPCQPIAWIESRRYDLPDYAPNTKDPAEKARHEAARPRQEEIKQQMVADLEALARQLGGDAVDRVHMGQERTHGWIADTGVPVPGAVQQGYTYRYFYIGEVVKYQDATPGETAASSDEVAPPVPAVPDISVEVLPVDESTLPPAPVEATP